MTIEEKRQVLKDYCRERITCNECALNTDYQWAEPVWYMQNETSCPRFITSPEHDLDVALALIGHDGSNAPCKSYDTVTKPEHYNQGGIECIDAIKASMSREEYLGFLKGQVIKYLWRYRHKGNPEQDLRKAEYYNTKLIDEIKEGHNEE